MTDGTEHRFHTVYAALGTRVHSDLACGLGARTDDDGALLVDAHQQSSVAGLYAAGDVVRGLSQISVAMGEAAVAATAINASLDFPQRSTLGSEIYGSYRGFTDDVSAR